MPRPRLDLASRRVRLAAHARPLRRGPGQVQFGFDPSRGVVLGGLSEAEVGWLLTMASVGMSASARTAGVLLGSATPWGISASRATELVSHLAQHHLLDETCGEASETTTTDPGPLVAGRRARARPGRVCVLGSGAAARAIHAHLDGLTHEASSLLGAVVQDPREADIAVLVVADAVGTQQALDWACSTTAHLPVVVQAHRVVVGPLVTGSSGPCLTCLDYYRRDRDRAWPVLMAQVDGALSERGSPVDIDPVLSAVTVGLCTMVLHAFLATVLVPTGLAWEVSAPWPRVVARQWPRHPACGHHVRVGSP